MATSVVRENPRHTVPLSSKDERKHSAIDELEKTVLHTIIFFPIDYDDPDNITVTAVENADNSLSTGPHRHMVRRPNRNQDPLAAEDMPYYFEDAHFERVQRRLRSIYFYNRRVFEKNTFYTEGSDTYAAEEKDDANVARRFLHQMPVFMRMLEQMGFRTVYARNLRSAMRHARRLKKTIYNLESPEFRPTRTPQTVTSNAFTLSSITPATAPLDPKVMLLTYRMVGSRIHMDSRAFDSHVGEDVLLYPSREEVALDSAKIYDLQAFDEVAKKGNHWRPAWHDCDLKSITSGGKECPFDKPKYHNLWQGKPQILKRGHSSCTSEVATIEWSHFEEPACYRALQKFHHDLKRKDLRNINQEERPGRLPKKAEQHILHNSRFYNYIHQEYVESLQSWGELRVFVRMKRVADPSAKGKFTRVPEVFNIIKTHFNGGVTKERFQKKYGPPKVAIAPEDIDPEGGRVNTVEVVKGDAKGEKRRKDEDRRRGYHVLDYRVKKETIKKLEGYIKARKLWVPAFGRALRLKSDYVRVLEQDDGARRDAQPEPDIGGNTAVNGNQLVADDAGEGQPHHADDANGGSAPQPNSEGEPEKDFFELPDEGPIVRCTYYTSQMNVSRLDRESTTSFKTFSRINIKVIENFAIQQYMRLFKRHPKHFESLNVGARVDIGISSKQELFLNEVTRWWFASWFSGYQDVEIQNEVAQEFADSFAEVYEAYPKEPDESDVESDDDEDDYDKFEGYKARTTLYKLKKGRDGRRERTDDGVGGGGGEGGNRGDGIGKRTRQRGNEGGRKGDEGNPNDDADVDIKNGKSQKPTKNSKKKRTPDDDDEGGKPPTKTRKKNPAKA